MKVDRSRNTAELNRSSASLSGSIVTLLQDATMELKGRPKVVRFFGLGIGMSALPHMI